MYKILKNKYLLVLMLALSVARADSPPPVSPAQAALDAARAAAQEGDAARAVEQLEALAATGFTGVGVITGDPDLSQLAGDPDFDALVSAMTAAAFPCEHDPAFSAFDFWVGDWDVRLADGRPAGRNRISREEHGCVLVEHWDSASGGTGMSINYLDEAAGEWVQVWNDASGSQISIRGGLTDEGMRLVGTIHYVANDTTFPFRGLWTPLEDGRVRQYFEQSGDGGETWQPWFEGFYSRREGGD
jgi:hypothetical protein